MTYSGNRLLRRNKKILWRLVAFRQVFWGNKIECIQTQILGNPSLFPACLGAYFATVDFSPSAAQTLLGSQSLAFLVPSVPLQASLGKQQVSSVK